MRLILHNRITCNTITPSNKHKKEWHT